MKRRRPVLRPVHRIAAGLAVFTALALVLTVGARPTYASWISSAKLGDSVGTASSTCTTAGIYRTTSTSRALAGSVAGVPLNASGALSALTANNGAGSTIFPSGVTTQGANAATTTVSSGSVTGAAAALTPTGSQTQYASATSTGTSTAAAGAVTTAGAIDTAAITGGTAPTMGGVDVSTLLGSVSGGTAAAGSLSRIRLSGGAVGATATLNECARRWGAALTSALSRSTRLSSLALTTRSATVDDLLAAVADRSTANAAIDSVSLGTTDAQTTIGAAAGNDLASALRGVLGLLSSLVGTPSATVSVATDLSGVSAAAGTTAPSSSGLVQLNGANGDVTADLGSLVGSTSPAPNTSVLTASAASSIASGTASASGVLVDRVDSAWDAALSGTRITVDVTVPLTGIASVTTHLTGSASQFAAGTESVVGPVVTVLPNATVPLNLDLTAITSIAPSLLTGSMRIPVTDKVIAPLTAAVSSTKSDLAAALALTRSRLGTQLAVLPTVVSITANEQPDVAPFPAPVAGMGAGYQVTAVRVKVLGGSALDLAIASSSVGPDTTINQ